MAGDVAHDGVDTARSGSITHNRKTPAVNDAQRSGAIQLLVEGFLRSWLRHVGIPVGWRYVATISGEAVRTNRLRGSPRRAHVAVALCERRQFQRWSGRGLGGSIHLHTERAGHHFATRRHNGECWIKRLFSVTATGVMPFTSMAAEQDERRLCEQRSTLALNSVGRSARGVYSVLVANSGGGALSSNAVLSVLVPQQFGAGASGPTGGFCSRPGMWMVGGADGDRSRSV